MLEMENFGLDTGGLPCCPSTPVAELPVGEARTFDGIEATSLYVLAEISQWPIGIGPRVVRKC